MKSNLLIIFCPYSEKKTHSVDSPNAIDGRYIWLPVKFSENGIPYLEWMNEWNLSVFD